MAPYEEAKALLLATEHVLETAVPNFISTKLGMPTLQDEKYMEDFWILDGKKGKAAICEVKSVAKGFKKGAIYDVYNHREKHDLPETFPALLFVNFNLQAGSWQKKSAPIPKDDWEIAVKNCVLIVRIEDLVQLWYSVTKHILSMEDIMQAFTTQTGWLECKGGELTLHK